MMVWHIFQKDWKLLWPLVMGVAGVQITNTAIWFALRNFGITQMTAEISELFSIAVFLVIGVLVAIAVQQDTLPGDRQDWLVRPIRRRDLMLAKLLFILIAVHGPMLLVDLALGIASGLSFWNALSAALSHGVSLLVDLSLPVAAVAAMTPNLVVLFGGLLTVGLLGFLAILLFAGWQQSHGGMMPIMGIWWVIPTLWSGLVLLVVGVTIPLQYFRRASIYARGIVIGAVFLAPIALLLPWTPAFSLQQRLSVDPVAAKDIGVAFDPALGRLIMEPGSRNYANSVWLPLHVAGLVPASIVINDRTYVRIISGGGETLYQGPTVGQPHAISDIIDNFPVRTEAGNSVRTHQLITLPGKIYDVVRSQPVRIELDYSLTLLRVMGSDKIAALNASKRIPGIGRCKTGIDGDGDEVEIVCVATGGVPSCTSAVLENTVSGKRNPKKNVCLPNYSPYVTPFKKYPLDLLGLDLSFRDPQGLAKYPVDSSQLANAQVLLKTYQPVAHFSRHLIIPKIRLGDWEAETPAAETSTAPTQR
jgi:hypothetical protein